MPDEPSGQHEPGSIAAQDVAVEDAAVEETESPAPAPKPTTAPTPPIAAEPVAAPADPGYSANGIPTFDAVREKIETRYGASLGSAELDAQTPEGRTIEEQYDARHKAAAERLDQIRASMHPPTSDNDTPGDH